MVPDFMEVIEKHMRRCNSTRRPFVIFSSELSFAQASEVMWYAHFAYRVDIADRVELMKAPDGKVGFLNSDGMIVT